MTSAVRSDAIRNRGALLEAARAVYAEEGLDAPLARIAQRAGVGRASLYRHFPDRSALVIAIFEQNFAALEARSAELAGRPGWFRGVFRLLLEQCVASRAFIAIVIGEREQPPALQRQLDHLAALLEHPLADAIARGELDDRWTLDDLGLVVTMLSGVVSALPADEARASIRRALGMLGLESLLDASSS